jgi:2-polyprenyl-6-methoxyphenol hydroxylase-like FAD-dependent oxidoreductase
MIDVAIAGGGPNGLMLACELALAGVRPVVFERLAEPATEPRANGLVGQVVRMLDRRGLYGRLTGSTEPPQPTPFYVFGAMRLDLRAIPDNPLYILPVPQRRVEQMLAERAAELGIEVRRGNGVAGLTQEADAVRVTLDDGSTVTARYLVGADGGHSAVRKLAGIEFPGVTTDRSVSRTAHLSIPAEWVDPATGGLDVPGYGTIPPFQHTRTEHGLVAWAPFPGRPPALTTVEWPDSLDFTEPMSLAEMRDSLRRVLGTDVPIGPPTGEGPHTLRRLVGGNTRIADRYRAGRVLLLGDAAHVHSAMGGPGLNLGLQDAVNLGWKLAAEVQCLAPEGLLDSYESERRPVAERVAMSTQAQSALVSPGADVTALRTLFGELLAKPENTAHIAALMAGGDISYETVERWAPDLLLHTASGYVRLADLTRPARALLLDFTGTLATAAQPWSDRVDVIAAKADDTALTALLLRPDSYVAWSSTSDKPDEPQLRESLTR